ncbi:MAG: hypothetical protein QOJ09_779 [Actinomycetota bacterium]|nr:hypothetical protein [Actinomycetota bacterium]
MLVARTTGAGWTLVVVCCVAAAILVGAAWPLVVVRRLTVAVDAPADAVAGRPLSLTIGLEGARSPLRLRVVDPPGEWVGAVAPARGPVVVVPPRRGVVTTIRVETDAAAPLGLVWWRRRWTLRLTRSIEVAPFPIEEPMAASALAARAGGEAVRTLREYVAGDAAKLIHWPSTARRGELVVKELEEPDRPGFVLRVVLADDAEEADLVAGRAMGAALGALRAGLDVTLLTAEVKGPQAGRVRSPIEAGRRLARAVPGRPADGPVPDGAVVVQMGGGT